jgi:hypothetical protein
MVTSVEMLSVDALECGQKAPKQLLLIAVSG